MLVRLQHKLVDRRGHGRLRVVQLCQHRRQLWAARFRASACECAMLSCVSALSCAAARMVGNGGQRTASSRSSSCSRSAAVMAALVAIARVASCRCDFTRTRRPYMLSTLLSLCLCRFVQRRSVLRPCALCVSFFGALRLSLVRCDCDANHAMVSQLPEAPRPFKASLPSWS